jgi:uncharacterized membrane protein
MAWGYTQIFSARAAFLHLGAFTATIMTANVAMIIMPNQRKVVRALKAGEEPDPALGTQAKQRSLHNNYLTLPVIFMMLAMHNPLAFATDYNWIIASLVFLMGVTIRHYFNTYHAHKGVLIWPWIATLAIFAVIVVISALGTTRAADVEAPERAAITQPHLLRLVNDPEFETVRDLLGYQCVMCHASEPGWPGMATAPKGVIFDRPDQIARHARDIYLQAGLTRAMPPASAATMEDSERQLILRWYEGAR